MMRKLLLACAAATTLLISVPSSAQLPVIDAAAIAQLLEEVRVLQQQLETAIQIFNSVNELVGADQWAPFLAEHRNPLPYMADDVPGYLGGRVDPTGLPYGGTYLGQNTVGDLANLYDGSFAGAQLIQVARTFSAMQATANNHVLSIENRIIGLVEIAEKLAGALTLQQASSISTRLHAEANYAHSQQIQAQNLRQAADLQIKSFEIQSQQWIFQDLQNSILNSCATMAAAGSYITTSACDTTGGGGGGIGLTAQQ